MIRWMERQAGVRLAIAAQGGLVLRASRDVIVRGPGNLRPGSPLQLEEIRKGQAHEARIGSDPLWVWGEATPLASGIRVEVFVRGRELDRRGDPTRSGACDTASGPPATGDVLDRLRDEHEIRAVGILFDVLVHESLDVEFPEHDRLADAIHAEEAQVLAG